MPFSCATDPYPTKCPNLCMSSERKEETFWLPPEQTSRSNLREVGDPKRRENIELQIVSFFLETQEKQTVEFGDQNGAFRAI